MLWSLLKHHPLYDGADSGGGSGAGGDGKPGASDNDANPGGNGGKGGDGKNDSDNGGDGDKGDFKPITSQADLDALIQKRLDRQKTSLSKDLTEQIKKQLKDDADAETKKKQGDFESLYKAELAKREAAEQERDTERKTSLKTRIAAKHNLPAALAARLAGDDEAALEADATELAKLVKAPPAAKTETGPKGGNGSGNDDQKNPALKDGKVPSYSFIPAGAVAIPPE